MRVNETKLMLALRDTTAICQRYAPENPAECGAMIGMFLTTAATMAARLGGADFSLAQIERFARAAQDGLNAAIEAESGRKRR